MWKNRNIEKAVLSFENLHHPHRDRVISIFRDWQDEKDQFTVLEIGCGVGQNLIRIAEVFPNSRLTGIDINEPSIRLAHEKMCERGLKNINVTDSDLKTLLGSRSGGFDYILSDAVLCYVDRKEIKNTLEELLKISKRGLLLVEPTLPNTGIWRLVQIFFGSFYFKDVWLHPYEAVLNEFGARPTMLKVSSNDWNSKLWIKFGNFIIVNKRHES